MTTKNVGAGTHSKSEFQILWAAMLWRQMKCEQTEQIVDWYFTIWKNELN